jgi:nucleotide-binding universal stress UspA family protein
MKRILVALDHSSRAPKVLEAAVRLAELTHAQLVLYRSMTGSPDLPVDLAIRDNLRIEDLMVLQARTDLETIAAAVPQHMIENIVTELATPADGICRTARERDVDLIVIGSHGVKGLDHVLGTVAAKVVNHADRNVLVVRTAL